MANEQFYTHFVPVPPNTENYPSAFKITGSEPFRIVEGYFRGAPQALVSTDNQRAVVAGGPVCIPHTPPLTEFSAYVSFSFAVDTILVITNSTLERSYTFGGHD